MAIFGVLRDPEVRVIWLADWISDGGNFVTFIALAVYVNNLTGSATAVGLALALHSIPWFTIGPFAGVLADRMDRRRVMIATNLVRAAVVGSLPFTHHVWQAYVLSLASASLDPVFQPARSALLAQVAPGDRLVPALAVTETTHQVLHTVGPALGGLAVFAFGARRAFFVDAASFVVAASFVATIRPRGRPKATATPALADLREGLAAVARTPAMRSYALLNAGLAFGYGGILALLVVYVRDVIHGPGGEYGLVLSAAGLGTVVTSLAIAARDARHARTPWVLASAAGVGAFVLAWARPSFAGLLPIAFVAGLADAGVGIPMTASIAETMSDDLRGRAYSVTNSMWHLATAAGSVALAWLGEPKRLGPARGLALSGGIGSALGATVLLGGGGWAIARYERTRLASSARSDPPTH